MEECTICVAYIFEIRETRLMLTAKEWLDHIEVMHRGTIVLSRAAEGLVEALEWATGVREAFDG